MKCKDKIQYDGIYLFENQPTKLNKMKKFNINEYIYIQITDKGWEHLNKTVGKGYIKNCIKAEGYMIEIEGEIWYRLQAHTIFDILPIKCGGRPLYNTNIMIEEKYLL